MICKQHWLCAIANNYLGIGTKAETGVRNGWYRAPATSKNVPPSPAEAAVVLLGEGEDSRQGSNQDRLARAAPCLHLHGNVALTDSARRKS